VTAAAARSDTPAILPQPFKRRHLLGEAMGSHRIEGEAMDSASGTHDLDLPPEETTASGAVVDRPVSRDDAGQRSQHSPPARRSGSG
jgi:hypothetical protein